MTPFDDPLAFFGAWPALAVPGLVLLAALLEYVLPPVPGDSCLLVGFFLAAQGTADPAMVFAAAVVGSVAGGAIAFRLGERHGMAVLRRVLWRGHGAAIARFHALVARRGERVLIFNRFLPVVRSVMLYGAGAFGFDFRRSMAWNATSAVMYVSVLCAAGWATAGSWLEIRTRFTDLNRTAGLTALAVVALWLGYAMWRGVQLRAAE